MGNIKKKSIREKLLGPKKAIKIIPDQINETIAQLIEPIDKSEFNDFSDFLKAKWKDEHSVFTSPKGAWWVNHVKVINPLPFNQSSVGMRQLMHSFHIVVYSAIGEELFKASSLIGVSESSLEVSKEYAIGKTPMEAVAERFLQMKGYYVDHSFRAKGEKRK